ncbi:MAG: T9SS type A sorting domain-containing protein [Bacteroidales bacterium]|jgi:hypothetical protein
MKQLSLLIILFCLVSIANADDLTAVVTNTTSGDSVGAVTLTVSGGVPPYTYFWSNAATTQNISGLSAGTYTVTVTDKNCGTASLSVTVGVTTNINEIGVSSSSVIIIYPNPATDNIMIESLQCAVIKITNIQGQLLETLATTGNKTTIDVSAFPSGVYVVEVKTQKGIAVRKFVKE